MNNRQTSAWGARALSLAAIAGLTLSLPGIALADPADDFQPQDDYEKMSVAQIEVELAKVRTAAADADVNLRKVAEEVAVAQDNLNQAKERSQEAQDAAERSRKQYEAAREKLASVAQTVYRTGGSSLDSLAPFLSSNGLEDVDRRAKVVEDFSRRADQQMQRVAALDNVANALENQAKEAEAKVQAASDEVEKRAQAAQASADEARTKVADAQKKREDLIAALAERRHVKVEEERQRQERIEAEQRARYEASEQARVAANGGNVSAAESERQAQEAARQEAASRDEERERQELEQAAAEEARRQQQAAAEQAAAEEEARRQAEEEERRRQEAAAANQGGSGGGSAALAWAAGRVGAPYVWGGTGPGYDCSGLVMMAYAQVGVSLPHSSQQQYWATQRVSINSLQPGDLVFYGSGGSANAIYHVAIYAGNGQILEATVPGDIVRYNPLRYGDLVPYGGRP